MVVVVRGGTGGLRVEGTIIEMEDRIGDGD